MSNTGETVTDMDGNIYNTVTIGTQVWMSENLKTTKYRNGDLIGTTTPATLKISLGSYQWAYGGNEEYVKTYGRLYTWYAISDSRNICPTGWHAPSTAEWEILTDYLANHGYGYGGSGDQIAKSMAAQSGWNTFASSGTVGNDQSSNNKSGFSALPSGYRSSYYSTFLDIGSHGIWWSSTENISLPTANSRSVYSFDSHIFKDGGNKADAFSVRCLRDF
jgi:uncharacterized protein (TIGR02145 family)